MNLLSIGFKLGFSGRDCSSFSCSTSGTCRVTHAKYSILGYNTTQIINVRENRTAIKNEQYIETLTTLDRRHRTKTNKIKHNRENINDEETNSTKKAWLNPSDREG